MSFLAAGSAAASGAPEEPTVSWQLLPGDSNGHHCIERFVINNADSVERLLFTQLPRPMRVISEGDSLGELNAG